MSVSNDCNVRSIRHHFIEDVTKRKSGNTITVRSKNTATNLKLLICSARCTVNPDGVRGTRLIGNWSRLVYTNITQTARHTAGWLVTLQLRVGYIAIVVFIWFFTIFSPHCGWTELAVYTICDRSKETGCVRTLLRHHMGNKFHVILTRITNNFKRHSRVPIFTVGQVNCRTRRTCIESKGCVFEGSIRKPEPVFSFLYLYSFVSFWCWVTTASYLTFIHGRCLSLMNSKLPIAKHSFVSFGPCSVGGVKVY